MIDKSKIFRRGGPSARTNLTNEFVAALPYETKLRKRSINGSDAAFCPRKVVLSLNWDASVKVTVGAASPLYFATGNAFHDVAAQTFKKMGVLVANELSIRVGAVHGYVDDLIFDESTGGLKIIDIKTCGKLPDAIKPSQLEQLMTYALLTGVWNASILYMSRSVAGYDGKPYIKEIEASMSEASLKRHALVIAASMFYNREKIVPPKPEYRTSFSNCGWCPFKNFGCWSNDEGDFHDHVSGVKFAEEENEADLAVIDAWANDLINRRWKFLDKTAELVRHHRGANIKLLEEAIKNMKEVESE